MRRIARLFVIKNRFDAYVVTFALAVGAMERGKAYLLQYPGVGGWLLFLACSGTVMMAGAKILDAVRLSQRADAAAAAEPSPPPRAFERDQGGGQHGTNIGTLLDRARGRWLSADDRGR